MDALKLYDPEVETLERWFTRYEEERQAMVDRYDDGEVDEDAIPPKVWLTTDENGVSFLIADDLQAVAKSEFQHRPGIFVGVTLRTLKLKRAA